ncbi:LysR family transcriptional regulator [Pseudomonas aeruginosa]|jgi:DNA-binding transcriptional LysR family regulator|nr:LysR family transcriptional regulator [Pseudomonas aeruginosa]MCS9139084.1 LysR family transcriptional regulator [Pseudomonas aeruginosa]MCS9211935.1 LysR family transcriptional regulator [Pseudomonas aeruginosa]
MDLLLCMQAFVRVAESGSFGRAAERLKTSSPTVSRHIAALEKRLCTRLLQRTTRTLALTEAGQRYLQRCKHIFEEIENAAAEAANAETRAVGCLRMHTITEFGQDYLLPLVGSYIQKHPEVVIDMSLTETTPSLLEEGLDVMVTLSRGLPDSEFVAQRLGQFHSVLCAAPAYLDTHGVPDCPEALHEHCCIMLVDPLYPQGWHFGKDVIFKFQNVLRVNQPEAACQAAAIGMGLCVLPNFVAAKAVRQGRLLRLMPDFQLHPREVHALYSSRRFLDAKIRTWVEHMKVHLPIAFERDRLIVEDPRYWAI